MIYPEARVQQALYFASLRVLVIHTKRPESDTHLSHPMRAHHVDFLGCLPSTARSAVPCLLPPIAVNLSVLKYRSSQNFLSISLALLTPILIADQIRFHFTFHFRSFRIFSLFLVAEIWYRSNLLIIIMRWCNGSLTTSSLSPKSESLLFLPFPFYKINWNWLNSHYLYI